MGPLAGKEPLDGTRTLSYPNGLPGASLERCCHLAGQDEMCAGFVYKAAAPDGALSECWPLSHWAGLRDTPGTDFYGPVTPPPPPAAPGWWVLGDGAADWYLAPAPRPTDAMRALYDLTGAPGVPPLYALGFMVTYWGYEVGVGAPYQSALLLTSAHCQPHRTPPPLP